VKGAGWLILTVVLASTAAAPWLSPNAPEHRFTELLYAPPTAIHLGSPLTGGLHIYPLRLVSRLERKFEEDREQPVQLQWFTGGRVLSAPVPLLLLGADPYGRDVLARLLYGGRVSMSLALAATLGAICLGAIAGAVAGYAGGPLDNLISRTSEFVLVLPMMYVALVLRAVMPLVIPPGTLFVLLAAIFTLVAWPVVARGVRGIIVSERQRDYIAAGRAAGAGPWRLIVRHLLPSARGHLLTHATLLLPAFILAEATLSYIGLGFPPGVPTWGTMLQDASSGSLLAEAPWMLAPAAAIFVVVLGVNLLIDQPGAWVTRTGTGAPADGPVQLDA
jgi:peptide/nickel transport system permease protein